MPLSGPTRRQSSWINLSKVQHYEMQFDKDASLPEVNEEKEQFSKDPFGGDTVVAEAGEDAEDIEPDYDETDKPKPAL